MPSSEYLTPRNAGLGEAAGDVLGDHLARLETSTQLMQRFRRLIRPVYRHNLPSAHTA
jgi:hypothetical protein